MALEILFFSGRTRQLVASYSLTNTPAANISLTNGLRGSSGGTFDLAYTSVTESVLDSIRRNTHFIAVRDDTEVLASGVSESCQEKEGSNGGLKTVSFYGLWEYLDEIPIYSSYKAGQFGESVRVNEDQTDWNKTLYGNNTMVLIDEILYETASNLNDHGRSPFFRTANVTETGNEWKSYELNSLEYPKLQSILNDLTGDVDCDPLYINPLIEDNSIVWEFSFSNTRSSHIVNLVTGNVGDLEFIDHQSTSASRSFVKSGTDNGVFYISNVSYDDDTAYSVFTPEESTLAARGENLAKINRGIVNNEKAIAGQLRYRTEETELARVGDLYILNRGDGLTINAVAVESQFDGSTNKFTVELTIISPEARVGRFRDPIDMGPLGRSVFGPIKRALKNSRQAAMSNSNRKTGWKNS